ncbi:tetraacyldisaccharide 4'-kinase [Ignatzschineria cameli]|uniref:Tetraacyldisaccharide 4'-kinase n=1 Tax=Ignatzschineria cameli TaxID=2182793 RepID=A0A2U2ASY2_9GAMM|nr:tetraacyldisaccharide 4'-kinase [Ignatzschineria cameli]PWD87850.1 tetraacyldisaccharide 4'-kinase [Ignatzschineria cameli]PWD90418.1 tetraacyldisaccharide 4'-kinase [Ignatzschineria cameli]PWD92302.1 tetraacyldisaccharide 4'-kinase [Ignatzschineria cameli]PWD93095.1 tetraacyldisaccharide 4'-kinase [Ignatzschineria cameli]
MLKTPKFWQKKRGISTLLLPLSYLYHLISQYDLQKRAKRAQKLPRPTIVIGNINVGGTGKTPTTITLTKALQARGLTVGILSRGFGRKDRSLQIVTPHSTVQEIGDEPYLIYQKTKAPMAIYSHRYEAGLALLKANPHIDCFICDDALQHRQLERDIEIIVVGAQGFGNGRLLPAGPLREPINRLQRVDFIICNQIFPNELIQQIASFSGRSKVFDQTKIIPLKAELDDAVSLHNPALKRSLETFQPPLSAIAGIAHPENFYQMLRARGLQLTTKSFPDHHQIEEHELATLPPPILMTEKDATKCQHFKMDNLWAVPLKNELPDHFIDTLQRKIMANDR